MKVLGSTPNNESKIVELTAEECYAISALQSALAGDGTEQFTFRQATTYSEVKDADLSDAFKAVFEFARARFKVNEIQTLVDNLRSIVSVAGGNSDQI